MHDIVLLSRVYQHETELETNVHDPRAFNYSTLTSSVAEDGYSREKDAGSR